MDQDEIIDNLCAALVATLSASKGETTYSKGFISGIALSVAVASGLEDGTFEDLVHKGADIAAVAIDRLFG